MGIVKTIWGLIVFGQLLVVECEIVPCKKFDFNHVDTVNLQQCLWKQQFHHKSYKNSNYKNKSLKPLNVKSEYYLTNQNEGESCAEINTIFKLNKTSAISFTYNMVYTEGAKLLIRAVDLDKQSKTVKEWPRYQTSNGWTTVTISNIPNIDRAKIQIETNMNYNSYLAIDNLQVLNSDINSEVCKGPNFNTSTTTTATTTISKILLTSTSEKVITTISDLPTEKTSAINTEDNVENNILTGVKLNFTTASVDKEKKVLESTTTAEFVSRRPDQGSETTISTSKNYDRQKMSTDATVTESKVYKANSETVRTSSESYSRIGSQYQPTSNLETLIESKLTTSAMTHSNMSANETHTGNESTLQYNAYETDSSTSYNPAKPDTKYLTSPDLGNLVANSTRTFGPNKSVEDTHNATGSTSKNPLGLDSQYLTKSNFVQSMSSSKNNLNSSELYITMPDVENSVATVEATFDQHTRSKTDETDSTRVDPSELDSQVLTTADPEILVATYANTKYESDSTSTSPTELDSQNVTTFNPEYSTAMFGQKKTANKTNFETDSTVAILNLDSQYVTTSALVNYVATSIDTLGQNTNHDNIKSKTETDSSSTIAPSLNSKDKTTLDLKKSNTTPFDTFEQKMNTTQIDTKTDSNSTNISAIDLENLVAISSESIEQDTNAYNFGSETDDTSTTPSKLGSMYLTTPDLKNSIAESTIIHGHNTTAYNTGLKIDSSTSNVSVFDSKNLTTSDSVLTSTKSLGHDKSSKKIDSKTYSTTTELDSQYLTTVDQKKSIATFNNTNFKTDSTSTNHNFNSLYLTTPDLENSITTPLERLEQSTNSKTASTRSELDLKIITTSYQENSDANVDILGQDTSSKKTNFETDRTAAISLEISIGTSTDTVMRTNSVNNTSSDKTIYETYSTSTDAPQWDPQYLTAHDLKNTKVTSTETLGHSIKNTNNQIDSNSSIYSELESLYHSKFEQNKSIDKIDSKTESILANNSDLESQNFTSSVTTSMEILGQYSNSQKTDSATTSTVITPYELESQYVTMPELEKSVEYSTTNIHVQNYDYDITSPKTDRTSTNSFENDAQYPTTPDLENSMATSTETLELSTSIKNIDMRTDSAFYLELESKHQTRPGLENKGGISTENLGHNTSAKKADSTATKSDHYTISSKIDINLTNLPISVLNSTVTLGQNQSASKLYSYINISDIDSHFVTPSHQDNSFPTKITSVKKVDSATDSISTIHPENNSPYLSTSYQEDSVAIQSTKTLEQAASIIDFYTDSTLSNLSDIDMRYGATSDLENSLKNSTKAFKQITSAKKEDIESDSTSTIPSELDSKYQTTDQENSVSISMETIEQNISAHEIDFKRYLTTHDSENSVAEPIVYATNTSTNVADTDFDTIPTMSNLENLDESPTDSPSTNKTNSNTDSTTTILSELDSQYQATPASSSSTAASIAYHTDNTSAIPSKIDSEYLKNSLTNSSGPIGHNRSADKIDSETGSILTNSSIFESLYITSNNLENLVSTFVGTLGQNISAITTGSTYTTPSVLDFQYNITVDLEKLDITPTEANNSISQKSPIAPNTEIFVTNSSGPDVEAYPATDNKKDTTATSSNIVVNFNTSFNRIDSLPKSSTHFSATTGFSRTFFTTPVVQTQFITTEDFGNSIATTKENLMYNGESGFSTSGAIGDTSVKNLNVENEGTSENSISHTNKDISGTIAYQPDHDAQNAGVIHLGESPKIESFMIVNTNNSSMTDVLTTNSSKTYANEPNQTESSPISNAKEKTPDASSAKVDTQITRYTLPEVNVEYKTTSATPIDAFTVQVNHTAYNLTQTIKIGTESSSQKTISSINTDDSPINSAQPDVNGQYQTVSDLENYATKSEFPKDHIEILQTTTRFPSFTQNFNLMQTSKIFLNAKNDSETSSFSTKYDEVYLTTTDLVRTVEEENRNPTPSIAQTRTTINLTNIFEIGTHNDSTPKTSMTDNIRTSFTVEEGTSDLGSTVGGFTTTGNVSTTRYPVFVTETIEPNEFYTTRMEPITNLISSLIFTKTNNETDSTMSIQDPTVVTTNSASKSTIEGIDYTTVTNSSRPENEMIRATIVPETIEITELDTPSEESSTVVNNKEYTTIEAEYIGTKNNTDTTSYPEKTSNIIYNETVNSPSPINITKENKSSEGTSKTTTKIPVTNIEDLALEIAVDNYSTLSENDTEIKFTSFTETNSDNYPQTTDEQQNIKTQIQINLQSNQSATDNGNSGFKSTEKPNHTTIIEKSTDNSSTVLETPRITQVENVSGTPDYDTSKTVENQENSAFSESTNIKRTPTIPSTLTQRETEPGLDQNVTSTIVFNDSSKTGNDRTTDLELAQQTSTVLDTDTQYSLSSNKNNSDGLDILSNYGITTDIPSYSTRISEFLEHKTDTSESGFAEFTRESSLLPESSTSFPTQSSPDTNQPSFEVTDGDSTTTHDGNAESDVDNTVKPTVIFIKQSAKISWIAFCVGFFILFIVSLTAAIVLLVVNRNILKDRRRLRRGHYATNNN